MAATATFHIRLADERHNDAAFVLQAHDSALPYLAAVGSTQWGTQPFSARSKAVEAIAALIRASEQTKQREEESGGKNDGDDDVVDHPRIPFVRTWIAETQSDATACAAASISDVFPAYVIVLPDAPQDSQDFFYLDRLITDRNVADERRKGAGAALLRRCKEECRTYGKRTLYTDCFAGPPTGLRSYYERNGFQVVRSFSVPSKHIDGSDWQGVLMRCDLD